MILDDDTLVEKRIKEDTIFAANLENYLGGKFYDIVVEKLPISLKGEWRDEIYREITPQFMLTYFQSVKTRAELSNSTETVQLRVMSKLFTRSECGVNSRDFEQDLKEVTEYIRKYFYDLNREYVIYLTLDNLELK